MAGRTRQVAVSTTPAELTDPDTDPAYGSSILIQAPAAADLWLGFVNNVGTSGASGGYPLRAGRELALDLGPERVWGVLASGTGTAYVIRTGS